jgi:hypothetical protein
VPLQGPRAAARGHRSWGTRSKTENDANRRAFVAKWAKVCNHNQ